MISSKKLSPLKRSKNIKLKEQEDASMIELLKIMISKQQRTNQILIEMLKREKSSQGKISTQTSLQNDLFHNVDESKEENQQLTSFKSLISIEPQSQNQRQNQSQKKINNKQNTQNANYHHQETVQKQNTMNNKYFQNIQNSTFSILEKNYIKVTQRKKEKYNLLSDILKYSDRRQFKLKIKLEEISKGVSADTPIADLENITAQWTGQVFRTVASVCWHMMLNGFLNFDETKILFTENITYNFIEFLKELDFKKLEHHKSHLTEVINEKSIEILQFLGNQYPQTKIQSPNVFLRQIIPKVDNSCKIVYDMIVMANKAGIKFMLNKDKNYSVPIMKLINFMIDQTNKQYKNYEKDCMELFEQIYLPPNQRVKTEGKSEDSKTQKIEIENISQYREKTKKYTKFLINRKIHKDVQKFSQEQISNGTFIPKSPSIYRIVTKWLQELIKIVKYPKNYIMSSQQEPKDHEGNYLQMFLEVKQAVCDKIIDKRQRLYEKLKSIKKQCFQIQSKLANPAFIHDFHQSYLSADQISIGKFSANLQKAISSYMFFELNTVLHFLLSIPRQVDEKNIGIRGKLSQFKARSQLNNLNLINFRAFDLLRCKCISNEQQIIWIVEYLKSHSKKIDLVRIKDRLSQGTRDISCNLRFKNEGFVSQMQLSVVSDIQKKQEMLDNYNHFLYQLKRSRLGPLSQNAFIWSVLQQKSKYFDNIYKKELPLPQIMKNHQNCLKQNLEKYPFPICCDSCYGYYPWRQSCILNFKCSVCTKTICGGCYIKGMSDQQITKMILEKKISRQLLKAVTLHSGNSLPLKGIYIKKNGEKKEINFFTILVKNRDQDSTIITHQQIQKMKKQGNKQIIPCEIIFVNSTVQKGQILEKQKAQPFFGKLCNGKLTVENNKHINQFYIFQLGVDEIQHEWNKLTLKQLQDFIRNQNNSNIKILNIIQWPVYVDSIMHSKNMADKLRQLDLLKKIKHSEQIEILVFKQRNVMVLAKIYKPTQYIYKQIIFSNNIDQIKSSASKQKYSLTIERKNLCNQLNNLQANIGKTLLTSLQTYTRKVFLSFNNIISIEGLNNLPLIEILYLTNNSIDSLHGLQDLIQLLVLRLDCNKITCVKPLAKLKKLIRLYCGNNSIKQIDVLKNLPQLKTISFELNQVSNIDSIKDLNLLQEINFKKNKKLDKLPTFNSQKLKTVNLQTTSLNEEQLSNLGNSPTIETLILKKLKLAKIPDFIQKLKLLKTLWISYNQISDASNLQNLSQLRHLSLQKNNLTSTDCLKNLHNLEILHLESNQLRDINGLKTYIDNLSFLNIKHNPINDCSIISFRHKDILHYTLESMSEKGKQQITQIMASKTTTSEDQEY